MGSLKMKTHMCISHLKRVNCVHELALAVSRNVRITVVPRIQWLLPWTQHTSRRGPELKAPCAQTVAKE